MRCALASRILCYSSFFYKMVILAAAFSCSSSDFFNFSVVSDPIDLKLVIIYIFCFMVVIWISIYIYFFLSWASYRDSEAVRWGYSFDISCLSLDMLQFTFNFIDIFQFWLCLIPRTGPERTLSCLAVLQSVFFFFPLPTFPHLVLFWVRPDIFSENFDEDFLSSSSALEVSIFMCYWRLQHSSYSWLCHRFWLCLHKPCRLHQAKIRVRDTNFFVF